MNLFRQDDHVFFKQAFWLTPKAPDRNPVDCRWQCRRVFSLESVSEQVWLKITADAKYQLFVNGNFLHFGPARGFQDSWPVDKIDIAPWLNVGRNVIAILLYSYGTSHYSYLYASATGLLVEGMAGNVSLSSGSEWRFRLAPGYINHVARAAGQFGFQEFCDLRKNDGDWTRVQYDDSNWPQCDQDNDLRVPGCMPWSAFEERHLPLLAVKRIQMQRIISESHHQPSPNWRHNINVLHHFQAEEPLFIPVNQNTHEVRFTPEQTAVTIDFGQETLALLQFEIQGAASGDVLDFMLFESLSGVAPDFPATAEGTCFGGRLILAETAQTHLTSIPWGGRGLLLLNRNRASFVLRVSAVELLYPIDKTGFFRSSDRLLEDIDALCERTQRCCLVDAFIDCPWREQAQWWGDALIQARNLMALSWDTRPLERGIRQIASQKTPDGMLYALAPSNGHGCILIDYCAIWILSLELHYFQTGSLEMFRQFQNTMQGILDYYERYLEDGLTPTDPRYFLYLDHLPALRIKGISVTYNLLIVLAFQSAARMAQVAGHNAAAKNYQLIVQRRRESLKRFLHPGGKLLDGCHLNGDFASTSSQQTMALAILADIFPEFHQQWAQSLLRPNPEDPLPPGTYFTFFIHEALEKLGFREAIIADIRTRWGEMAQNDFLTIPEYFPEQCIRGKHSFCHAWSAHPIFRLREIILGVKCAAPGWRKVIFNPLMSKGQFSSGEIPTAQGLIRVQWDWRGEQPSKSIQLPEGVTLGSES